MLSVRLDKETEARLDKLAKRSGRSKSFYARQAIEEKIEEMEDYLMAEKALDRIRSGKDEALSREDFLKLIKALDNALDD